MSDSRRKPWFVDGYNGSRSKQFYKRHANRVIRRTGTDIANGGSYRKLFDSYYICDFKWLADLSEEDEPWKVYSK